MSLESFPRGGKKPEIKRSTVVSIEKKYNSDYELTKEDKRYIAKQIAKEKWIITIGDRLSKVTLKEESILLGRVSKVKKYEFLVSLPGGFLGYVEDTDISQSYRGLLRGTGIKRKDELYPLSDLFKPGDYVTCYIKSISRVADEWSCSLSLEPQLINQNVHPNNLVKGFKIICSVISKEDHGYVVDTGILNVTAFLATENVEKGKQYLPNTQLLCTIKEVKTAYHATFVQLSTKKKKLVNIDNYNVESLGILMPGIKFSLRVERLAYNCLVVYFGKNKATIHQTYLKHPLSTYKPGMNVTGTLLYCYARYNRPSMQERAFFSELDDTFLEKENLRVGEIIEEAKVLHREGNGVILKLSESGHRGYVAFRRTKVPFEKIKTVFREYSIHKCRVLSYSWMDHLYICTTEELILNEKYFTLSDVNIGEIITVTIEDFTKTRIYVIFGKLYGTVSKIHLSDNGLYNGLKLKRWDKVEARVLSNYPLEFTLKQSLIKSKLPVLKDFSEAKCGLRYHGTITLINNKGILVRFYGKTVKGWVPHTTLNSDTRDMNWNFFIGQTVKVCVTSVDESKQKMRLKIVTEEDEQQTIHLSIGESVTGIVTESSDKGIYMKIQQSGSENFVTGFLPAAHMAPCLDVGNKLASCYSPGDVISAFVFATKPILLMSRTYVTQEKYRNFDSLKEGDCIPCTIREISNDGVKVIVPCENYSKLTFIPYKNMGKLSFNFHMYMYEIIFAKITAINKRERELTLTTSLKAVWESMSELDVKIMMGMDLLILYLKKIAELEKFYKHAPISSLTLGQKVNATVKRIDDFGTLLLQLNDHNVRGHVHPQNYLDVPKEGDTVFGVILWKDYVHNVVEMSLLPRVINSISSRQDPSSDLTVARRKRAEIVLITNWFILVVVKHEGKGYLAAMPVFRHKNDIPDLTPYKFHAKVRVYIVLNRADCEATVVPTCMLKSAFAILHSEPTEPTKNKQELKRKRVPESNDVDLANPPKKVSKEVPKKALEKENEKKSEGEVKDKESRIKDIDEHSESDEEETEEEQSAEKLCVPECGFLWDDKAEIAAPSNAETSSSDDEEESEEELEQKNKKKKKLNATERREQKRQEEREIRQQEEVLASNQGVNVGDDFEKLVLASPNNSLVWARYMAHHIKNADIDKARAVASRALKVINMREEIELMNLWKSWLNMESKFGTVEHLDHVFQESLKANDEYKMYAHILNLHAEAGRKTEFEKVIDKMIRKFKKDSQTWIDCGAALLKIGMKEKSRQFMQRALQSLPESEHVNLLAQFANLENKLGDKKRAHTLFENILSSYPKRVDVWSSYVDCLIKSKDIDSARKVLKRACVQTLSPRKMKTLFKKFVNFEEKYGTSEDADRVRQMAMEYVDKRT